MCLCWVLVLQLQCQRSRNESDNCGIETVPDFGNRYY